MKKFQLKAAGLTDVGTRKQVNEDGFVYKIADADGEHTGIFAVADGVGSLTMSDLSSAVAISHVNRWWEEEMKKHYGDLDHVVSSLLEMLKRANSDLLSRAQDNSFKMGTTLSVLVLHQGRSIIVHIGDSRIYRIRGTLIQGIQQLTEDHSCMINTEFGGQQVRKSVLTQCLGNKEDYRHFCAVDEMKKGDIYLLCSDGIFKTLSDTEILRIAKDNKNDMAKFCSILVNQVKVNGETDNITAIAVQTMY